MNFSHYDKKTRQLIEDCERLTVAGDKSAPRHLRMLLKTARAQDDFALLGFVHFYFANWYYDDSKYEKFQSSLRQAIYALLRSDARDLLARAYNFFAIDAQSNDAFDVAYSYYMSALQFADEKDNPGITGVILHNLATFYYAIGDHRIARTHFRKSLRLLNKNKEDPFYRRNVLIAYISEAVSSLMMGDLPSAKRAHEKMKTLLKKTDAEMLADIMLSYRFFELRYALAAKDRATVKTLSEEIMDSLDDEALSFVEMDDIRDFCHALLMAGESKIVGAMLERITPQVLASDITHAMRLLAEVKVDYYDQMHDEKNMIRAMQTQHRLLLRQKEEQAKIYQYSMDLIRLIGELQEEEAAVRLENEHLQTEILTDVLTGIPNRYAFDKALAAAFERAYREKKTLGIEIMDVDGFKDFNDTFGHQIGDLCLEKIGGILKRFGEEETFFCARYGGDEFVLIFEGKSDQEIRTIAKRINQAVAESVVFIDGKKNIRQVTMSQGVCNDVPKAKSKPWDFLSEADAALYAVKGKKKTRLAIRKRTAFG